MKEEFGSELGYLPEVLDSAQEAFDHLWVNGEKFEFSADAMGKAEDAMESSGLENKPSSKSEQTKHIR